MNELKKLPTSLGFDGFLNGNIVTYGCRTFTIDEYQKLYDVLIQFGIKSYKIPFGKSNSGDVTTEELAEILRVAKS